MLTGAERNNVDLTRPVHVNSALTGGTPPERRPSQRRRPTLTRRPRRMSTLRRPKRNPMAVLRRPQRSALRRRRQKRRATVRDPSTLGSPG